MCGTAETTVMPTALQKAQIPVPPPAPPTRDASQDHNSRRVRVPVTESSVDTIVMGGTSSTASGIYSPLGSTTDVMDTEATATTTSVNSGDGDGKGSRRRRRRHPRRQGEERTGGDDKMNREGSEMTVN